MNTVHLYYDSRGKEFYDPWTGRSRLWVMTFAQADLVRVRLAVTNGRAFIDDSGKPLDGYRVSLSTYTGLVWMIKTSSQTALGQAGTAPFAQAGYDTADTDWHLPSGGMVSQQTVLPFTVPVLDYCCDYTFKDAVGNSWTLDTRVQPLIFRPIQKIYTGSESTAPAGLPGGQSGTFSIAGAALYVDITVAGMTAAGQLSIGTLPPTGDPGDCVFTQTPSTGKVRISVATAPGAGNAFNGNWTLVRTA